MYMCVHLCQDRGFCMQACTVCCVKALCLVFNSVYGSLWVTMFVYDDSSIQQPVCGTQLTVKLSDKNEARKIRRVPSKDPLFDHTRELQ